MGKQTHVSHHRDMIAALEDYAMCTFGAKRLRLVVRDYNSKALKNYLHCGFTAMTYWQLDAWEFDFSNGSQNVAEKNYNGPHYAWAVRSAPVPIPGGIWLLGSGLAGIIGFKKLKRNGRD